MMEAAMKTQSILPQRFICLSLGIIYIWFGTLKFFPGISPAEQLAGETINSLSFRAISASTGVRLLAIWEVGIGLAFMLGLVNRKILILYLLHMLGTFTPLVLLPEYSFSSLPFVLTLVGQYIIKNILFIAVGFWLWKETNS